MYADYKYKNIYSSSSLSVATLNLSNIACTAEKSLLTTASESRNQPIKLSNSPQNVGSTGISVWYA